MEGDPACEALVERGSAFLEADKLSDAHAAFSAALQQDPMNRKAWAGLGVAFERAGNLTAADHAWRLAFKGTGPIHGAYRGESAPVRILVLRSVVEGNVPLDSILDDRLFQWATLLVESFDEEMVLPPHDVVFNAVGSADLHTRALAMTQRALRATNAPVINDSSSVGETERECIAERLRAIPGVVTPHILRLPRVRLSAPDAAAFLESRGFAWPLLVRIPGYHGGEHFVYVADETCLESSISALPGDDILVLSFIDARCSDRKTRKYRVLSIDGRLYPLHLAISQEWKVHYFSADLTPEHRREEELFLTDMRAALGDRAVVSLEAISRLLRLDYAGIDFTVVDGDVVVFEANATMSIPSGEGEHEPYRRDPIQRAIDAVRTMIAARARAISA